MSKVQQAFTGWWWYYPICFAIIWATSGCRGERPDSSTQNVEAETNAPTFTLTDFKTKWGEPDIYELRYDGVSYLIATKSTGITMIPKGAAPTQ